MRSVDHLEILHRREHAETIDAASNTCRASGQLRYRRATPLNVIAITRLKLRAVEWIRRFGARPESNVEDVMGIFAALDVSQEETAICLVGAEGEILAEAKVPTCPDAIADWLAEYAVEVERVGMETGPLAVWLWNALTMRQVPIICLDARHANAV
jgi:hypothetical protein